MREVFFFCAEEDNSQYIGLWLEAPLFELRFAESGRRLSRPQLSPFTIPFFTSRLLTTSDRRQPRFNTIAVVAIKFFSLIFHCCGKSFISASESQDVVGNESTGRFLVVHRLHAAAHTRGLHHTAARRLVSLQVCSVLPHSRTGANICGLSKSIHVYSALSH